MDLRNLRQQLTQPQLGLGLGLTFLLALAGQIALLNQGTALGLLCYAAASASFVLVWRARETPRPAWSAHAELPAAPGPGRMFWFTGLALLVFAVLGVNAPGLTPLHHRLVALAWLLSVAVFTASALRAVAWQPPRWASLKAGLAAHRLEILGVAGLAVISLGVRIYALQAHPYAFIHDEGSVGIDARSLLRGEIASLFDVGWSAQPILSFVPTALSIGLFGSTIFAVRIVSAIQGALTVVIVYLLARETFDRATASLAAGFLVVFPFHVHFSRLGVNNVVDGLLASLVLWLTFRAVRRGQLSGYLWAGLAAGLALYTYVGSRLVPALALATLAYAAARQRDYLRTHVWHLVLFGLAAVVVMAPMAAFFAGHPGAFMERINKEGILQNGWLVDEAARTGQSAWALLLQQFSKSSLVFVSQPAWMGFFHSPQPYLTALAAIFFVLGMGYALARADEPFCLILLVWFWAVVVLGSTLTVNAPTSERLVMAIPPTAIFFAIGLRQTAGLLQRLDLLPARAGLALCAGVVALTGLQGGLYYFGEYRQGYHFSDSSNELALESIRQVQQLGPGYRLYLLAEPFVLVQFPNFKYLAPEVEKQDLGPVTAERIAALPRDKGALFVALPSRRGDLNGVAQWLPGGLWHEVLRQGRPETLYYAYQLAPDAWP